MADTLTFEEIAELMLTTVKTALRISHDKLNEEIKRLIVAGLAELLRVGVSAETIQSRGSLVTQAVVTYVSMHMTEDASLIDKYSAAFDIQVDGIRKAAAERVQ